MKISIDDVKQIVNKVTQGGGVAITRPWKSNSQRWW